MDWLDLLAVQGTLKSLLQHHSSKASILRHSAFFIVQCSHPYMTTGKTIALTRWTFVGKVMSLLLNTLSRLVITLLPSSKRLLISWLQSPSAVILEPPKVKSDTVSTVSPYISHEVMGPDAMIFVFWMLSSKPTFSLSSLTFINRLFSLKKVFLCLHQVLVVAGSFSCGTRTPGCGMWDQGSDPRALEPRHLSTGPQGSPSWCFAFLALTELILCFASFFFSSPSGIPVTFLLNCWILSQESWMLWFFSLPLFFLFMFYFGYFLLTCIQVPWCFFAGCIESNNEPWVTFLLSLISLLFLTYSISVWPLELPSLAEILLMHISIFFTIDFNTLIIIFKYLSGNLNIWVIPQSDYFVSSLFFSGTFYVCVNFWVTSRPHM